MGCQSLLQSLVNVGTQLCTSEQLTRRVVWTNICAIILSMSVILVFILIATTQVSRSSAIATTIRFVFFIVQASVLILNKFGKFTISRCILILSVICAHSLLALSSPPGAVGYAFVLIIPLAMSSTLFEPTAYTYWVPLHVLCAVCYTGIQWLNEDTPGAAAVKTLFGLLTMVIISVCFHLLAQASRLDEQKLAQMVIDLQSEIDARKVVEESLRNATQAKQIFLATMSHEIRTPMNGVVASAELLSETSLNAEQQDLTDTIKSSALALISIINDILDFSKIEAGKMTVDSVSINVREVAEQVLGCVAPGAEERGVELVCDVAGPWLSDGAVLCDAGRFRQVLLNILGNAVKFTDNGSVVVYAQLQCPLLCSSSTISNAPVSEPSEGSSAGDNNDGENGSWLLQVEVEDTGEGIGSDHLERMFEEFTQADTSISRRHGGTGLGLAISKKLVELMGGSISVKSQLGQGSTFTFSVRVGVAAGGAGSGAGGGAGADPPLAFQSPRSHPQHSAVLPEPVHSPPLSMSGGAVVEVVVVVWEPLARARDALCRLLHHHQQQQQGQDEHQMELVVRPVLGPSLTAVMQVLEEAHGRSSVLVSDYRTILRSRTTNTEQQGGNHQKNQQQQWELLCDLLTRLDTGVVLLGPISHRSGVETGIVSKCEDVVPLANNRPPPQVATTTQSPNNNLFLPGASVGVSRIGVGGIEKQEEDDDDGRWLGDLLHPRCCGKVRGSGGGGGCSSTSTTERNYGEDSCTSKEASMRRWGYVNKPVHQATLLRTLCAVVKRASSSSGYTHVGGIECGDGVSRGMHRTQTAGKPPQPPPQRRVLVVEDNKVNQKVMGKMLKRLGLVFDVVENGKLAVDALRPI